MIGDICMEGQCSEHSKLYHMVEQLDKKLGNGWAREVKTTLNDVQRDISSMKTDIAVLKERPRNKSLFLKDIALLVTSISAIVGIVLGVL